MLGIVRGRGLSCWRPSIIDLRQLRHLATMAAAPETQPEPVAAAAGDAAAAAATTTTKKLHGRAFYESIGSPKFIVAPMVNQSEFVSPSNKIEPSVFKHEDSD